nr:MULTISPECIES: phage/plasmid primase, P4 family [unclassified Sphingomonas]
MLEAALDYAARGWSVFPCSPVHKRPLVAADKDAAGKPVKGTGGVCKATTNPDQVRAWWSKWPSAMIGIAMGSNRLFALDFDPRVDPDTGEEWTLERLKGELEAQIGGPLPASLAVRTPSGGVHVYLQQPTDGDTIRNRGNLPEHVDVRGEGGYVIAPPSVMKDGRRYRWLRDDAGAAIVPAPAALVTVLQARKGATPTHGQPKLRLVDGAPPAQRYAMAALDRECQTIQSAASGARQNALNRGAYSVAQLVAAGAIGEPLARSAIMQAALANPGNDDRSAIEATIDSGWTAGMAQPRDLSAVATHAGNARQRTANDNPPLRDPASEDALNRRLCQRPFTDLGNAERFAARYGDRVRYVDKMGWIAYDGRRFILDGADALIGGWTQDTVRTIRAEAKAMVASGRRDLGVDGALDDLVETKRDGSEVLLSDKLLAWAKASESATRLACIPGIAKNIGGAGLTIQPEQLDRSPFLINVLNGTLELVHEADAPEPWAKLTLRPHDPADLITRLAPVEYRPGAECPVYDRFLARVQPAEDMRRFLHQWGGLSLTGDVSEQKLAFFHGKGANGKSTLVDTWATIAGDLAGTVPIETFLDQGRKRKGSDASPDLAALVGVRLLRTSEPEKGSKLAEALIKLATGGEPMSVRRLNRDPFDLYPQFKMTMSGNHRPSISGIDDGIWRRVMLVPWEVQIPDAEKDRQLVAKMQREASGILNRLLAGLTDWRLHGLQEPAIVRGATADYREESDPMGRFLAACTAEAKGERVQSSKLHALFIAWARAAGEREWTQTGFSKAMLDRGHRKVESHGMRWLDLTTTRVPADFEDPDAIGVDDRPSSPHPFGDDDDRPI